MRYSTIVVDDHAIVRRGIVQVLNEHPSLDIVAEVSDYIQLKQAIKKVAQIDLLIMDVGLPGKDGIEILKLIKEEYPKVRTLMVSMYPEEQYAVRAFKAGASGYLNKSSAPERMLEAIDLILSGKKYVTPEIAQALVDNLSSPQVSQPHERLSDREFQTLKLIASGKRLTEIAEIMMLSPKTVSVYRSRLLEKMELSNNAEITHYAIKNGIV